MNDETKRITERLMLIGCKARVRELVDEIQQVLRIEPKAADALPSAWNRTESPGRGRVDADAPTPAEPRRRGRRPMTAKERKAASARMKKRWAALRKGGQTKL